MFSRSLRGGFSSPLLLCVVAVALHLLLPLSSAQAVTTCTPTTAGCIKFGQVSFSTVQAVTGRAYSFLPDINYGLFTNHSSNTTVFNVCVKQVIVTGTFSFASTSGISFVTGTGSSDTQFEVSGNVSALNGALATLTYSDTGVGTHTLRYGSSASSGCLSSAAQFMQITIIQVPTNTAPNITSSSVYTVAEDSSITITDVRIGDADHSLPHPPPRISMASSLASTINATVRVDVALAPASAGSLTWVNAASLSTAAITSSVALTSAFTAVSLNSTIYELNAKLFSAWKFTPVANYEGNVTVNVTVCDGGNFGTITGVASELCTTALLPIVVTGVNDPPTVTVPATVFAAVGGYNTTISGVNVSDTELDEAYGFGSSAAQAVWTGANVNCTGAVNVSIYSQNGGYLTLSAAQVANVTNFTVGDGILDSIMSFYAPFDAVVSLFTTGLTYTAVWRPSSRTDLVYFVVDDKGSCGAVSSNTSTAAAVTVSIATSTATPIPTATWTETISAGKSKFLSVPPSNIYALAGVPYTFSRSNTASFSLVGDGHTNTRFWVTDGTGGFNLTSLTPRHTITGSFRIICSDPNPCFDVVTQAYLPLTQCCSNVTMVKGTFAVAAYIVTGVGAVNPTHLIGGVNVTFTGTNYSSDTWNQFIIMEGDSDAVQEVLSPEADLFGGLEYVNTNRTCSDYYTGCSTSPVTLKYYIGPCPTQSGCTGWGQGTTFFYNVANKDNTAPTVVVPDLTVFEGASTVTLTGMTITDPDHGPPPLWDRIDGRSSCTCGTTCTQTATLDVTVNVTVDPAFELVASTYGFDWTTFSFVLPSNASSGVTTVSSTTGAMKFRGTVCQIASAFTSGVKVTLADVDFFGFVYVTISVEDSGKYGNNTLTVARPGGNLYLTNATTFDTYDFGPTNPKTTIRTGTIVIRGVNDPPTITNLLEATHFTGVSSVGTVVYNHFDSLDVTLPPLFNVSDDDGFAGDQGCPSYSASFKNIWGNSYSGACVEVTLSTDTTAVLTIADSEIRSNLSFSVGDGLRDRTMTFNASVDLLNFLLGYNDINATTGRRRVLPGSATDTWTKGMGEGSGIALYSRITGSSRTGFISLTVVDNGRYAPRGLGIAQSTGPITIPLYYITPTETLSHTVSDSLSGTRTGTISLTATASPSNSTTQTPTRSDSISDSISGTRSDSITKTRSDSISHTVTATRTSTRSDSLSHSGTPTTTLTRSPTRSDSLSHSATRSPSDSISHTPSPTRTGTRSHTVTRSVSPSRSGSDSATPTTTLSHSASHTATVTLSASKSRSDTITYSSSRSDSISSTPTMTLSKSRTVSPSPTPSPSKSRSGTRSDSVSHTATVTLSRSGTRSDSLSHTKTWSPSPTPSASTTLSRSFSPSVTTTLSKSHTATQTLSHTFSPSATLTRSHTRTGSATRSDSISPSVTLSHTATATLTPSATLSSSPSKSHTTSATLTQSSSDSVTHSVTLTKTSSDSITPSTTLSPSNSTTPSVSTTLSTTVTLSRTPSATLSRSFSHTYSPTATPIPTPTRTHTVSASRSQSDSQSRSASATGSPTITPIPTWTHSPTETLTDTPRYCAYFTDPICTANGYCNLTSHTCICAADAVRGHWTLTDCSICAPNYYGESCNVHCQANTTCRGLGTCASDGTCACFNNATHHFAGATCESCVAPFADFSSGCTKCLTNFYNANCSTFCSRESTCSGHGDCSADGTSCVCDASPSTGYFDAATSCSTCRDGYENPIGGSSIPCSVTSGSQVSPGCGTTVSAGVSAVVFSTSGASIVVQFSGSVATYSTVIGSAVPVAGDVGAVDCNDVLASSVLAPQTVVSTSSSGATVSTVVYLLGINPKCYWTSRTALVVTLGDGFTLRGTPQAVTLSSSIYAMSTDVQTSAGLFCGSVVNPGPYTVQIPDSLYSSASPLAALRVYPQTLTACSKMPLLDASASFAALPIVSWKFSVANMTTFFNWHIPAANHTVAISALLATITESSATVDFTANTVMPPRGNVTIRLTITDLIGRTSTADVWVYKPITLSSLAPPEVEQLTPVVTTPIVTEATVYKVDVISPTPCPVQLSNGTFVAQSPVAHSSLVRSWRADGFTFPLTTVTTDYTFTIPKNTLVPGIASSLRFSVSAPGTESTVVTFLITGKAPGISVAWSDGTLGDVKRIAQNGTYVLSAIGNDPLLTTVGGLGGAFGGGNTSNGLSFEWSCKYGTSLTGLTQTCPDIVTATTAAVATGQYTFLRSTGGILTSGFYRFFVTAKVLTTHLGLTYTRTASISSIIEVVAQANFTGSGPAIAVFGAGTPAGDAGGAVTTATSTAGYPVVNIDVPLRLYVPSPVSNTTYVWESSDPSVNSSMFNANGTSVTVPAWAMSGGNTYSFSLKQYDSNGNLIGSNTFSVATPAVSAGTLTVDPGIAIAGVSEITLTASGFTDVGVSDISGASGSSASFEYTFYSVDEFGVQTQLGSPTGATSATTICPSAKSRYGVSVPVYLVTVRNVGNGVRASSHTSGVNLLPTVANSSFSTSDAVALIKQQQSSVPAASGAAVFSAFLSSASLANDLATDTTFSQATRPSDATVFSASIATVFSALAVALPSTTSGITAASSSLCTPVDTVLSLLSQPQYVDATTALLAAQALSRYVKAYATAASLTSSGGSIGTSSCDLGSKISQAVSVLVAIGSRGVVTNTSVVGAANTAGAPAVNDTIRMGIATALNGVPTLAALSAMAFGTTSVSTYSPSSLDATGSSMVCTTALYPGSSAARVAASNSSSSTLAITSGSTLPGSAVNLTLPLGPGGNNEVLTTCRLEHPLWFRSVLTSSSAINTIAPTSLVTEFSITNPQGTLLSRTAVSRSRSSEVAQLGSYVAEADTYSFTFRTSTLNVTNAALCAYWNPTTLSYQPVSTLIISGSVSSIPECLLDRATAGQTTCVCRGVFPLHGVDIVVVDSVAPPPPPPNLIPVAPLVVTSTVTPLIPSSSSGNAVDVSIGNLVAPISYGISLIFVVLAFFTASNRHSDIEYARFAHLEASQLSIEPLAPYAPGPSGYFGHVLRGFGWVRWYVGPLQSFDWKGLTWGRQLVLLLFGFHAGFWYVISWYKYGWTSGSELGGQAFAVGLVAAVLLTVSRWIMSLFFRWSRPIPTPAMFNSSVSPRPSVSSSGLVILPPRIPQTVVAPMQAAPVLEEPVVSPAADVVPDHVRYSAGSLYQEGLKAVAERHYLVAAQLFLECARASEEDGAQSVPEVQQCRTVHHAKMLCWVRSQDRDFAHFEARWADLEADPSWIKAMRLVGETSVREAEESFRRCLCLQSGVLARVMTDSTHGSLWVEHYFMLNCPPDKVTQRFAELGAHWDSTEPLSMSPIMTATKPTESVPSPAYAAPATADELNAMLDSDAQQLFEAAETTPVNWKDAVVEVTKRKYVRAATMFRVASKNADAEVRHKLKPLNYGRQWSLYYAKFAMAVSEDEFNVDWDRQVSAMREQSLASSPQRSVIARPPVDDGETFSFSPTSTALWAAPPSSPPSKPRASLLTGCNRYVHISPDISDANGLAVNAGVTGTGSANRPFVGVGAAVAAHGILPGDCVVLSGGTYSGFELTVSGRINYPDDVVWIVSRSENDAAHIQGCASFVAPTDGARDAQLTAVLSGLIIQTDEGPAVSVVEGKTSSSDVPLRVVVERCNLRDTTDYYDERIEFSTSEENVVNGLHVVHGKALQNELGQGIFSDPRPGPVILAPEPTLYASWGLALAGYIIIVCLIIAIDIVTCIHSVPWSSDRFVGFAIAAFVSFGLDVLLQFIFGLAFVGEMFVL